MSIDWTKPLELTDGTPVVLKPDCMQPEDQGDYVVQREDNYVFYVVRPNWKRWLSPNDSPVLVRNRAPTPTTYDRDAHVLSILSRIYPDELKHAYAVVDALNGKEL